MATKKSLEELRENKIINQAKREVPGFAELLGFERTVSVWEEAKVPFKITPDTSLRCRYISGKFLQNWIPSKFTITFLPSEKSKSPSQSYFKHTVYGLRFLLKSEGLSYDF